MDLNIQIQSLLFSFLYGCVFYFLLDIFNKFNNNKKIILKIVLSLLFVFLMSLLYFLGLIYINNGYLHIYFLLSIVVGYLFVYFSLLFTHKKK